MTVTRAFVWCIFVSGNKYRCSLGLLLPDNNCQLQSAWREKKGQAGMATTTGRIITPSDGCALGKLLWFFLLISLKHVKGTN